MINRKIENCYLYLIFLCLWILCFGSSVVAQVEIFDKDLLGKFIDEIEVTGNKVTREEIILREMRTRPGSIADNDQMNTDLLRIIGLDLFSRVEFRLIEDNGKLILKIEVTEEWYIFPMPFWNISSHAPHELTYGFRYMHKNFRGRAESLRSSLWGGEHRGFQFTHITPWVANTPNMSRSIDLRQVTKKSRNIEIEDLELETRQTAAQVYFGKRWTIELSSSIGTRFRLIQGEDPRQVVSESGLDRVQEAMFWTTWDGRDLKQLPRKGWYCDLYYSHGWLLNSKDRFQRFVVDLRKYLPVGKTALCSRIFWSPGWGEIPPYDKIVVRQTSPIRSARLSDEGKSLFLISTELRFDLFRLRYFTWHKSPRLVRQHVRNLKYGLAATLFVDAGDTYTDNDLVNSRSIMWGYGTGLLVRLPYVDVIRLESSWNPEYSLANFVLSWKIGVSF